MAHCESMSLIEFQQRFSDDEACENYLFEARWPNGFHCPNADMMISIFTLHVDFCNAQIQTVVTKHP